MNVGVQGQNGPRDLAVVCNDPLGEHGVLEEPRALGVEFSAEPRGRRSVPRRKRRVVEGSDRGTRGDPR